MKTCLKVLILMLFALTARAQDTKTHFLFGPEGGYDFGNTFIGGEARIEVPLGHHFEVNGQADVNPFQSHIALGHGFGYSFKPGVIVWVNHTSGFEGNYSYGAYSVTKVSKASKYVYGGYVYRHTMLGFPTRFHFDYLQQVQNGISANGTETNHVMGGEFAFDTLEGCFKSGCVRSELEWNAGRVLNQGNPVCDGTGYPNPQHLPSCPRTINASGGFQINLLFEFPRRANSIDLY